MQWPPTPGPGVNFMNPNGFVAAAEMTSQTSRPIRSHRRASWFTRAMFTFRKMFSRSFASSAASGDDSEMTWSLMCPSSAAARAVAAGVVPPTSRGIALDMLSGSPGFTRSGAKARSKSVPARRPPPSIASRNGPTVVPGNVVDWRITSWPLRMWVLRYSAAPRTGPRSGSFDAVIGVGTQTITTSASAVSASSVRRIRRPPSSAVRRRSSEMSSIGDRPEVSSSTRAADTSTPRTSRPASTKAIDNGRPT